MKKIILFDMDGTLTPARQQMSMDIVRSLSVLQENGFEIGIVTGSDLNYVQQQCESMFDSALLDCTNIHYLPCNGTKYYTYNNGEFNSVYEKNMRKELGEGNWTRMIRLIAGLQFSLLNGNRNIPVTGNFINYRGSTLNWCPIGRQANKADRSVWKLWDIHSSIRRKWIKNARETFDSSGLENVVIKMGGDTSFDIYPEGWDKTYAFKNFDDYDKIYFIGDRCGPSGNDREAYELAGDLGFDTSGPQDTIEIINRIIMENK